MMISSHWQLCIVYCCWSVTQCVQLFVTPWTAACQASLSFTISEFAQAHVHWVGDAIQPSLRPLLLPSIFPAWESFSSKSALHIRWPEYCTFSFSISPSNEYQGWFPLGLTDWISSQSKGLSRVFSSTTVWKHQFFGVQLSLWWNSHIHTWLLEKP